MRKNYSRWIFTLSVFGISALVSESKAQSSNKEFVKSNDVNVTSVSEEQTENTAKVVSGNQSVQNVVPRKKNENGNNSGNKTIPANKKVIGGSNRIMRNARLEGTTKTPKK